MKAGGRNPVDISQGRKKGETGDGAEQQAPGQEERGPVAIPRTAAGFLERITLGDSIKGACAAVGVTVSAYEKWRDRFDGFPEAVEAARAQHQQWVRCGLMEDDAFAMQLLSRIMRDENQPVLRRQRAATQILNRKGKRDWVPDAIPAGEKPLRPWDGFEIEENLAAAATGRNDGAHAASRPPAPGAEPTAMDPTVPPVSEQPPVSTAPMVTTTTVAADEPQSKTADAVTQVATGNTPATPDAAREHRDSMPPAPVASTEGVPPGDASRSDASNGEGLRHGEPGEQPTEAHATPKADTPASANPSPDAGTVADSGAAAPPAAPPPTVPPPPKPRKRETVLTDQFLAATFLHKHEPREAFERLLRNQLRAYAPATPQEEILTLRITQKSWVLRRLDTFDRVIADSAVTKVREKHPNAAPAACIAMTFLTRNDTEETRFHDRIAKLRREHEAMHDRLESKLHTLQERRIARDDRHRGGPALNGHPQGGLSGNKVVEMTPDMGWEAVAG